MQIIKNRTIVVDLDNSSLQGGSPTSPSGSGSGNDKITTEAKIAQGEEGGAIKQQQQQQQQQEKKKKSFGLW